MMVHDVMDWIKAPLSIAVFGFLFWQLNHLLHRRMGVAYGQIPELSGGETSFDRWMGIATMLLLLPLILVFYWFDSPYIRIGASVVWPVVVMIALGFVRHLHSGSSILFQAGHGASVSLITWFVTLRPDAAECSASASSIPVEPRIALLTYCASLVQFWINTWLTACLAFTAIFAATLIAMYTVKLQDFGWTAHPNQRHVLAIVYTFSAVLMLVEVVVWLGVPLLMEAAVVSKTIRTLGL